jgi:hypothetical protein
LVWGLIGRSTSVVVAEHLEIDPGPTKADVGQSVIAHPAIVPRETPSLSLLGPVA